MNHYDLNAHLGKFYAQFPEAPQRPVIGITANFSDGDATLRDRYYKQLVAAGATPIIIPPLADEATLVNILDHIEGLLLICGCDFNPLWCGEEPSVKLHNINAERDLAELLITRLAYNRQIPMLGICRGIQTLAMALDGNVVQDIYQKPLPQAHSDALKITMAAQSSLIKHSQDARQEEPTHSVLVADGSYLSEIYAHDLLPANGPTAPFGRVAGKIHVN